MVSAEDDNWPKHVLKLHVQKLSYVPQKKKKKGKKEDSVLFWQCLVFIVNQESKRGMAKQIV